MSAVPDRPVETPQQWLRYAEGALLNEYIVAGRYPGDIAWEQTTAAEAREALEAAQRIRAQVRRAMSRNDKTGNRERKEEQ